MLDFSYQRPMLRPFGMFRATQGTAMLRALCDLL
jgi:hypothetical protein